MLELFKFIDWTWSAKKYHKLKQLPFWNQLLDFFNFQTDIYFYILLLFIYVQQGMPIKFIHIRPQQVRSIGNRPKPGLNGFKFEWLTSRLELRLQQTYVLKMNKMGWEMKCLLHLYIKLSILYTNIYVKLWINPKNVLWGSGLVLISIPESGSRCESHCNSSYFPREIY